MAQNIDDFNRGAALALAHFYERCPVPAMLKIAKLDRDDDLLADGYGEIRVKERRSDGVIIEAVV